VAVGVESVGARRVAVAALAHGEAVKAGLDAAVALHSGESRTARTSARRLLALTGPRSLGMAIASLEQNWTFSQFDLKCNFNFKFNFTLQPLSGWWFQAPATQV
jgi:hypothetical protein